MSEAHISSPVSAQGAGGLLPGNTAVDVSSSQTHPAGSHGSAGAFWGVPAYDAVLAALEAERDRASGIRSWAELRRRAAIQRIANEGPEAKEVRRTAMEIGRAKIAAAVAVKKAARRLEVIAALQADPPPPSLSHVARTVRVNYGTVSSIAKEIGCHDLWQPKTRQPKPAPAPKRGRAPRKSRARTEPRQPRERAPRKPRNNNVPKQAKPELVEILCLSCRKPFMSWDKKLNRRCKPNCEGVAW